MKEPRKPLRQRVAERKAGIESDKEKAERKQLKKRLRLTGAGVQIIGILLLIPQLYAYLETGDARDIGWNWIIAAFVVFVAGRILNAWASMSGPFRW